MRKRFVLIGLILIQLLTLTGCWDAVEINELGFVLSVALDKSEEGYKVTAQIAKPDTYSKTSNGGVSKTEKEKPYWVIGATGKTIFEAIRNMAAISPRRIFWAHIKVILISEELARDDIRDILDFFTRNPELRLRTLLAVTPEEAGKLLEVLPMMEKEPATHLEMIIENRNLTGKGYRVMLKNFLEKYLEPNGSPVASRIVQSMSADNPVLESSGAAVFSSSKMVGWLEQKETRGLLWIENDIRSTIMVVSCPYDGKDITVEVKSGKTSFECTVENGVPTYLVKVKASANLVEQGCGTDFTQQKALYKLRKALESEIKKDIQSAFAAAQKFKVDFLGLNEILHGQDRKEWKKLSANWPETLSKSKLIIEVKVDIPSVSLLAKPLNPAETER